MYNIKKLNAISGVIYDFLPKEKYNVSYEKGLETVEGNAPIDENEYLEGLKYTVKENEEK